MSELSKQQQAIQSELTSMDLAASDQSRYLRLTHTLREFRQRLHAKSETLGVPERQKILRLLVKEILVGPDTITVRHSLPIVGSEPPSGGPVDGPRSPGTPSGASYLLRSGSDHCSLWRPYLRLRPFAVLAYSRFQPFLDQAMNSLVGDSVLDETHRPFVTHVVEKATYVRIHDPVHSLPLDSHDQRIHRVVRAPPRPQSLTETPEILLIDCVNNRHHRLLYDFIFQRRDAVTVHDIYRLYSHDILHCVSHTLLPDRVRATARTRDRILPCIGRTGYPAGKSIRKAPAQKTPRGIFAFCLPRHAPNLIPQFYFG